MIIINQLSKSYGNKVVLENISMSLQKGNVYGIVGDNGAGKTTLFDCIAGMQKFDGFISSDFNPLKNFVAYFQAESYFFPKTTGREYIQFINSARGLGKVSADEFNRFELPLDRYIETYSTGMKKKLALTALLSIPNELYILDEPFNGVDIHSNISIIQCIKFLKQHNKIILITSHIFETLQNSCDCIFRLQNGNISKQYYPNEYQELYESLIQNQLQQQSKFEIRL